VQRAAGGGLPATIYRPALVTASASGRFVRRDIAVRVLGYMIRHGVTVDASNQVSFLPVDVCARNIVAISLAPDASAPVMHLTADEYYSIGDVCSLIAGQFGYRFKAMGLQDFVAHAHAHCTPDDALYPLLSFLDRNTSRLLRMGDKRYVSDCYKSARDRTALAVEHPDLAAVVEPIVSYLIDQGMVPPAPVGDRLSGGGGLTGMDARDRVLTAASAKGE
jgi:thioester reductase-like protein